jgi:hypothetical protein
MAVCGVTNDWITWPGLVPTHFSGRKQIGVGLFQQSGAGPGALVADILPDSSHEACK